MHLDRHGGTPYPQALDLPRSFARGYFESEVYQQDIKVAESRQKLDVAVVTRLDAVIKALGELGKGLGKALSGRR